MYTESSPLNNHHRADWLNLQVRELQRSGGLAFRGRDGEIIIISPSSKRPGWWQATWFAAGGPYRDRLASSPRRLLWQVQPWLQTALPRQQAESSLRRMLS